MSNRSALVPAAALALFALAACNDSQVASAPNVPPPSGSVSMFQGTVDGAAGTVTFAPVGLAPDLFSSVSPAIYGAQGSTVSLFGKVDSTHDLPGVSRTWYIRIGVRNLLAYPIGSNYGSSNPSPPDTSGVYVFFMSAPVVTLPVPCVCTLDVINAMGVGNFNALGQKYFWYGSRPTAVQGAPGTDTTLATPQWLFKTTPFTGVNSAQNFTFVVMVSAAWPPPNEPGGTWTMSYDGTADSLPDTQAEPRWKKFPSAGVPALGAVIWLPAGLTISNVNNGVSTYFAQRDSLGTGSAFMKVTGSVTVSAPTTTNYKAIFGFVEPQGGVPARRQVFVGVSDTRVGFVNFNEGSGQWGTISQTTLGGTFNGGVSHVYKLRKIGTNSATLCVDGNVALVLAYANWNTVRNTFNTSSAVFGSDGRVGGATSLWRSVAYTIGADGTNCT